MRHTEFWKRMNARFGEVYADSLARDLVLAALGGRTVHQAIRSGVDLKEVWLAVCEVAEVPARDR
ncbi:MAG: DUF3046 domain-containing protein [Mycobacteriales bacterium]|nr:DUF3046 domain-containing protein [Frankia sp.]